MALCDSCYYRQRSIHEPKPRSVSLVKSFYNENIHKNIYIALETKNWHFDKCMHICIKANKYIENFDMTIPHNLDFIKGSNISFTPSRAAMLL